MCVCVCVCRGALLMISWDLDLIDGANGPLETGKCYLRYCFTSYLGLKWKTESGPTCCVLGAGNLHFCLSSTVAQLLTSFSVATLSRPSSRSHLSSGPSCPGLRSRFLLHHPA